jgi:hypothetical protein
VTVVDITGDVKSHGETRRADTHYKKACEVDIVEVLRIKKKVGYTQIFSESTGDHREQYDPAHQQHVVALQVVQQ